MKEAPRSNLIYMALALLACVGIATAFSPQGGILKKQQLGNCEVDVRPKYVNNVESMEAQVYWEEVEDSDPADQRYGTRFTVHVPADEKLELQDYRGQNPVVMYRAVEYVVEVYWDNTDSNAYLRILKDGVEHSKVVTRKEGSYDELASFVEPTWEYVEASADNLDRIRFTSESRGVTTKFCIESR